MICYFGRIFRNLKFLNIILACLLFLLFYNGQSALIVLCDIFPVLHGNITIIYIAPVNRDIQIMFSFFITKTCLFKYTEILPPKSENFQMKNFDIFHISAQNIDCGYSLEPHRRGGSNEYQQSML